MDESDAFNWFYYACQRALSYVREPHIQGQDRRRARRIFHDYLRTIARKRQLKRVQFGVASAAAHKAIWSWIKFAQNIFMYNFHRAQLWSLRCEKFNFRSEQVHCTDFHLRCCSDISHTVWSLHFTYIQLILMLNPARHEAYSVGDWQRTLHDTSAMNVYETEIRSSNFSFLLCCLLSHFVDATHAGRERSSRAAMESNSRSQIITFILSLFLSRTWLLIRMRMSNLS